MNIKTKDQYEKAVSRIEQLYALTDEHTPADSPLMMEMDDLGKAIEAYEDIHYPIAKPTLATVLEMRMCELGLNQKAVAAMLHVSPESIARYMKGKCSPSLKTARLISQKLNIDASTVLGV